LICIDFCCLVSAWVCERVLLFFGFVIGFLGVREGYVLDDLRSDDLAGTAPGGEEVDDHHAGLVEGGIEVGLTTQSRRRDVSFLRCADRMGRKGALGCARRG
jgi:hypothetical protein